MKSGLRRLKFQTFDFNFWTKNKEQSQKPKEQYDCFVIRVCKQQHNLQSNKLHDLSVVTGKTSREV